MMMKSTFSLALLAGFASGAITGFSVTSVLTKDTPGHLEIKFTPGTAILAAGAITFELPASSTSFLTPAIVGNLRAVAATTLNGGLTVAAANPSVDGNLAYTFTRVQGSLTNVSDLAVSTGEITITFGPVTSTKAGLVNGVFKIKTTQDTTNVTHEKGVRVADALCNGAATGYGCACVTTEEPKPTFLCTEGKTCHKDGADVENACKVVTPAVEACANTDGKTKNTKACDCEATNASAVKTKYTCKADQVCDVKATTADTACKARASNGSSLLLLAAFFLAMN